MKTIFGVNVPECVNDILEDKDWSHGYYYWAAEGDNDFINNAERAERCHDAAECGGDGKLHCEAIDDFRDYGRNLLDDVRSEIDRAFSDNEMWDIDPAKADEMLGAAFAEFDQYWEAYEADVVRLEQWHIENGSYEQEIG